jgi:xanthine/uracil permease
MSLSPQRKVVLGLQHTVAMFGATVLPASLDQPELDARPRE